MRYKGFVNEVFYNKTQLFHNRHFYNIDRLIAVLALEDTV